MSGIDDLLREANSKRRVAGVAAAAATREGVLYQGAFGRLSEARSSELRINGVFRIASMTKATTSLAAMQLVERGQLDLDADAGEVLPELRDPHVLEGCRAVGGLAWAGIFNSYFWIDMASGVCGVLLTQILPFFDREVVSLFEGFERAVYDSL